MGVILGLVAFFLVTFSLFGIWFTYQVVMTAEGESSTRTVDFGLTEGTVRTEGETVTTSYTDLPRRDVWEVYYMTQFLGLLSMMAVFLFLISSILVGVGKVSGRIDVIFGLLASLFIFVTLSYFVVALPPAYGEYSEEGPRISLLWGSDSWSEEASLGGPTTTIDNQAEWGAGWAWFMTVIALIFTLTGSYMVRGKRLVQSTISEPGEEDAEEQQSLHRKRMEDSHSIMDRLSQLLG
jgi:hypothetical protein